MTTDIDSMDSDALSDYAHWLLETGIWDGRPISWQEASDFRTEVEQKIIQMLFSQNSSAAFDQMAANFARLGADPENQTLLARDIQELALSPNGVIQVGFCKSVSKFWKKHKTEILIGVGVAVGITVIIVVAVCSGGTGAGAAAAGGVAALGSLKRRDEEDGFVPAPPLLPEPKGKTVFLENGVMVDGQYTSYRDIVQRGQLEAILAVKEPVQNTPEPKMAPLPRMNESWTRDFFETIGRGILEINSDDPDFPPAQLAASRSFVTEGSRHSGCRIGGTNGINTSFDQANDHAGYLKNFTPNQSIEWVYNHSNGVLADLAEVASMNYLGSSPNTSKLLEENWTAFHEENKDDPNAKYLQFCHSQGAIHVRNGLLNVPKEIRDRVIVVAIAPGTVVPKELCYRSFNYASKNDFVPSGEIAFAGALDTNEFGTSQVLERVLDNHNQLILLDRHPDATGLIDHSFQSPTFKEKIKEHIEDYIMHSGEYK